MFDVHSFSSIKTIWRYTIYATCLALYNFKHLTRILGPWNPYLIHFLTSRFLRTIFQKHDMEKENERISEGHEGGI